MNWWRTPYGTQYAEGFITDVNDKGRWWSADLFRKTPGIESNKLERAEPVHVDANVCRLVQAAVDYPGFKAEPIVGSDLFTVEGFALLDDPVQLADTNGLMTSIRAFSWGPCVTQTREETRSEDGELESVEVGNQEMQLHFVFYANIEDEDDYSPRMRAQYSVLEPDGSLSPENRAKLKARFGGTLLSMYHAGTIRWGSVPQEEDGLGDHSPRSAHLLLQAFFRLAEQKVLAVSRFDGDRHSRKRVARLRQRLRSDKDGVLVVRLRREKQARKEEGESSVEWSCQWPVSGHWRNQWYPTDQVHRQIWIDGYIKGPEDKALRVHAGRAFEFNR